MTKPILWLLCLCTAMPFGAKAQSTMTYTLNFDPSDFTINRINGDTSIITSTKYDIYSNYDPTQPELPVIYVTYLLPPGKSYVGFSYLKDDNPFQPGVILKNGCKPLPTGKDSQPSPVQGYPSVIYPSSIEFVQTSSVCGYRTVTFKIMPIRYNAIMHDLMIANISLTLQLAEAGTLSLNNGKRGERERNYVLEKIWNKDSMSVWYTHDAPSNHWIDQHDHTIHKDKYLILTNNLLKSAFAPLADWKRLKGLDVETVTVEEIASEQHLAGTPTPKDIKQYLRNYYFDTSNNNDIDFYVLLGGDVNIIPIAYCETPIDIMNVVDDDSRLLPSDMYYACVSDDYWDWDSNSNGILGQYQTNSFDSIVFFNDLYVSRASVRDSMEVEVFVNKVIQYESNPPLDSHWGKSVLFLGNRLKHYPWPNLGGDIRHYDDEGLSRFIIRDELDSIRQDYTNYLCSTGTNLPYDNLITDGSDYMYVNSQRATEQFRNNYSLICEFSHGAHNLWQLCDAEDIDNDIYFDNSITDTITSSFPKVVVTVACYSNEFDTDTFYIENSPYISPSLSESMMRNSNSGIVAFVGSSRCGYNVDDNDFNNGNYFKNSNRITRDFVRCLYNTEYTGAIDEKKLGKAVDYAKKHLSPSDEVERKLLYVVNTLGDPEMDIYTEVPKQFTNVSLTVHRDYNDFVLLTGGVFGTKLYDTTTGKLYYSGENDTIHVIETGNLDSIDVVLMKENYVPLHITLRSKYIQNETYENGIENVNNYECIYVGRDVTTDKPVGNVVVKQGSGLKLNAKKEIKIKNGFSVESGGTFEMDVEQ